MTDRIVVGTGWCAFPEGHNNPAVSRKTQDGTWLERTWRSAIQVQITPDRYLIYHSNCPIDLHYALWPGFEAVHGIENVRNLPHHHDWFASVLMAAMYAWTNKASLVYIEQDCLVRGLAGAIKWARDYDHVFGFGPLASWREGWAEHSFFWTRHAALPWFIAKTIKAFQTVEATKRWPEVAMAEAMMDATGFENFGLKVATWPFGYGRKRPIDLREAQFYIQQPTDEELANVVRLIHEDAKRK